MSNATLNNVGGGGGSEVDTLTGNTGGPVSPTANNINVVGDGITVEVSGNPGTSTLTISSLAVATSYVNVVGPATYVASATDFYISCDSSGGLITIQLPDAPQANRLFVIKDRTGSAPMNSIDITTVSGTTTIDIMETVYDLTDAYESVEILYNTGNYEIF